MSPGSLIFIKGSGNPQYYIGFLGYSDINTVVTNGSYNPTYNKSTNTLTMPTIGYYYYSVIK